MEKNITGYRLDFVIPKGDQGEQGPKGDPGISSSTLSAYGGKYNHTIQNLTSPGLGSWIQIPLPTALPSINLKETEDNTLTLEQDGVYEINYFLKASVSKQTSLTLIVRKNSMNIPSTVIMQELLPNTENLYYGSTLVNLNADDKVDMEISTTEENVIVQLRNGMNANLTIKKIDELNHFR